MGGLIAVIVVVVLVVAIVLKSFHSIGSAEVGLVSKRFAFRKLHEDNPIAFHGEAGYQATLLMPGLRFKLWPMFGVKKFPWVQVPAGEIGVVIAQVGQPLPIGAKSARVQDRVRKLLLTPRASWRTADRRACNGRCCPRAPSCRSTRLRSSWSPPKVCTGCRCHPSSARRRRVAMLTPQSFGLSPDQLRVVVIAPDGADRLDRRRHHARRPAAAVGRHREPARRVRRHLPDGTARRRCARRRPHRSAARQQERRAQQLPGLPGIPRRRREDRPAARPAALWRVPSEPVPRARRSRADARREPGRGCRDQGLRRPSRRSTRRERSSSSGRSCDRVTAASGRSRCAPASTRSTPACTRPRSCRRSSSP